MGWFWLGVSFEATIKMSVGAVVISKFHWENIHFQASPRAASHVGSQLLPEVTQERAPKIGATIFFII